MPSNCTLDLSSFKLVEPLDTKEKPVREELSQSRLKELLHYNPKTGVFTRRIATSRRVKSGDIAGSKNGDGYILIMVDSKRHLAHRLAWLYMHGVWPTDQIDHINGDRADNRRCNLREATRAENAQNTIARPNNKVGYLGVTKDRSKYKAQIGVDGAIINLGLFATPEQAHQAYLSAKAKFHNFQPIPRAK